MLCSCLFFLFGFIFFTTLITHYFCSFESESSNGPRFKPDGVTGSGLPLQSGMTDYPSFSISADPMPSARPEWIRLQLTTGLWVSATFSCSLSGSRNRASLLPGLIQCPLVPAVYGHQLCALGLVDTRGASGVSKVAGADDCPPD